MSSSSPDTVEALDETDLRILRRLQEDARVSYDDLGNNVGLAESSARYRVKRLEELGVIQSYMSVLDVKKLGFDLVIFAELDVEAGKEQLVAQKLQKLDNIIGLFSVSGQPDMMAIILARNNEELTGVIERIRGVKEVHKMTSIFALRTYKFDLAIKAPIRVS